MVSWNSGKLTSWGWLKYPTIYSSWLFGNSEPSTVSRWNFCTPIVHIRNTVNLESNERKEELQSKNKKENIKLVETNNCIICVVKTQKFEKTRPSAPQKTRPSKRKSTPIFSCLWITFEAPEDAVEPEASEDEAVAPVEPEVASEEGADVEGWVDVED